MSRRNDNTYKYYTVITVYILQTYKYKMYILNADTMYM